MDVASYKKAVYSTLSVANAKTGLKTMLRNRTALNIGHAIVGLATETGEFLVGVNKFVLGFQLSDDMKANIREELGDCMYYATVGAKELKVKIPSSTKKVKSKQTMAEQILLLNRLATEALSLYKHVYYGRGLGSPDELVTLSEEDYQKAIAKSEARAAKTGKPFDASKVKKEVKTSSASYEGEIEKLRDLWGQVLHTLYGLCWVLLNEAPSVVMDANIAKLAARYPEGTFDQAASEKRDLKKEQDASDAAIKNA